MFKFEELRVYQESIKFTTDIYSLTHNFPKEEMFNITDQIRRASISICLNIAEGSSRTKKDFQHFLSLSRGSCYECVAILNIAFNLKLIALEEYKNYYEVCDKLSRMLSKLRVSLN